VDVCWWLAALTQHTRCTLPRAAWLSPSSSSSSSRSSSPRCSPLLVRRMHQLPRAGLLVVGPWAVRCGGGTPPLPPCVSMLLAGRHPEWRLRLVGSRSMPRSPLLVAPSMQGACDGFLTVGATSLLVRVGGACRRCLQVQQHFPEIHHTRASLTSVEFCRLANGQGGLNWCTDDRVPKRRFAVAPYLQLIPVTCCCRAGGGYSKAGTSKWRQLFPPRPSVGGEQSVDLCFKSLGGAPIDCAHARCCAHPLTRQSMGFQMVVHMMLPCGPKRCQFLPS
jgi:hypothetical protein